MSQLTCGWLLAALLCVEHVNAEHYFYSHLVIPCTRLILATAGFQSMLSNLKPNNQIQLFEDIAENASQTQFQRLFFFSVNCRHEMEKNACNLIFKVIQLETTFR